MKRRKFLQATAAGVTSLTTSFSLARELRSLKRRAGNSDDVLVIGAGAFGAWTAYNLRRAGLSVTLVDANGAGNSVGSSGGHTRMMRAQYGTRLDYTRMALRAAQLWKSCEEEWRETLVHPADRIKIWPGDKLDLAKQEQRLLAPYGIKVDVLNASESRKAWPQISFHDDEVVLHTSGSHDIASASIIFARRSGEVLIREFQKLGGTFKTGAARPPGGSGPFTQVELTTGERLSAGTFVFACGPWLPELFPELLASAFSVQKRYVYFLNTPAADLRYSHPRMPLWGFFSPDWYGFPAIEDAGFKVAHGADTTSNVEGALQLVRERFRGLNADRLKSLVQCQDAYTLNKDFLIDQHPAHDNVWIVGGGSGHAFKQGPAIGEHVTARILGREVDAELDAAFRWKSRRIS